MGIRDVADAYVDFDRGECGREAIGDDCRRLVAIDLRAANTVPNRVRMNPQRVK